MRDRRASTWILTTAFLALCAIYLGLAVLVPSGVGRSVAMSVLYLLVPTAAVFVSFRATRRFSGSARTMMWLVVAALLSNLCGEAYWGYYQTFVDPKGPPVSLADVGYFAFYALMLVFVLLVLRSRLASLPVLSRLKAVIDSTIVATVAGVGAVSLLLAVVLPTAHGVSVSAEARVYAAYALLDVSLLVGVLAVAVSPRRFRWHSWEALVAGALVLFSVGDLVVNFLLQADTYALGDVASSVVDLTWLTGSFLLGLAVMRFQGDDGLNEELTASVLGGRWKELLPVSSAVIFVPLFIYYGHEMHDYDSVYWVLTAGAILLIMLTAARWAVMIADNRALAAHSITDGLTGSLNHRFFHELVAAEIERSLRTGEYLSVALVDLDDFRLVNESLGHLAGDRRLRLIASTFAAAVRAGDSVCRIGGDEFAFLLPATSIEEARLVCLRVTQYLAARQEHEAIPITVSIGIAELPTHAGSKDDLLMAADRALYFAKDGGRNRIATFDPERDGEVDSGDRLRRIEQQSLLRTVSALAAAVDVRDAYTHSHSRSVAGNAAEFGAHLGFGKEHRELLRIAGLLHDVGKIGIRDEVLRKSARLTAQERAEIETHADLSSRILAAGVPDRILPWVRGHHERWDGSGYPDGLVGDEIPLEARIIAVCDSFDAMVSERPYRAALSQDSALEEIRSGAGSQFDPHLATAFVEMMEAREASTESAGDAPA